jgi:hypothetical protein
MMNMKSLFLFCLVIIFCFSACKDDTNNRELEVKKALKEKTSVFNTINKAWIFSERTLTPESQTISSNWSEWRLFINELNQKPKGTIGAFQRKTKSLVQKADAISLNIPPKLNKPQIKSRIMAMVTKVKSLHIFLNLQKIPQKKVIVLISDLNIEVNAIQDQIEEIVRRDNIQLEEGEGEMLNSLKGGGQMITAPQEKDSI